MPFDPREHANRWRDRLAWLAGRPVGVALALGAALRLALYYNDRGLWLDEVSLVLNIGGRSAAGLFAPYQHTQLAPAGFVTLEWLAWQLLDESRLAMRLVPLLGGLGALAGFAVLARKALAPTAAAIAVFLFAVSGDLIWYASELKPYSTDVCAAVIGLLMGESLARRADFSWRRGLAVGLLGAGLVWLSFPAALVLAGVGGSLIVSALADRAWRRVLALVLISMVWAGSFAVEHRVASRMLGEGAGGMQAFWAFGFPPWPPAGVRDALWPVRRLVFLSVNPLDGYHAGRSSLWPTALPVLVCLGVGAVCLWRRDRLLAGLVLSPLPLALAVAYPRLYPFHGRLALYLMPTLLLTIAEGLAALLRATPKRFGRLLRVVLLSTVFVPPGLRVLGQIAEPRYVPDHNPVGDVRPPRVDPERFPF